MHALCFDLNERRFKFKSQDLKSEASIERHALYSSVSGKPKATKANKSMAMKKLKQTLVILLLSISINSCRDEVNLTDNAKTLIVGEWNGYESGKKTTGIHPGISGLGLLTYEHGISFYEDGEFGSRYYLDDVWTGGARTGTYEVRDDQTILLVFSPGTGDEREVELTLLKLDNEHLWFEHSLWVNDQNPEPWVNHLERVK
jgi:hypothetical protein